MKPGPPPADAKRDRGAGGDYQQQPHTCQIAAIINDLLGKQCNNPKARNQDANSGDWPESRCRRSQRHRLRLQPDPNRFKDAGAFRVMAWTMISTRIQDDVDWG